MREYRWQGENDGKAYTAYIDGIKFCWTVNSGDKETSGSGTLLARHFFKPRWQEHFKKVFDKETFCEISNQIQDAYARYEENPDAFKKS